MTESQVLETSTLDDTKLGIQFKEYINSITDVLGINNDIKESIENEMAVFDSKSKYKIISDVELKTNVNKLLEADKELHKLVKKEGILHSFYNNKNTNNKDVWDQSMKQVARLQGLIILRKISHNDCDGLIKSLLGAFDTKLKAVNELLSSDLKADKDGNQGQTGGSDYLVKYLKYKNKYLKLLKNNM